MIKSRERGALALEAALVIPILLIISIAAISITARTLETDSVARATAEEAARAASQQQTQSGAYSAAQAVLDKGSDSENIVCSDLDLTADLQPGGQITASVTCVGSSQPLPGFPSKTVTKTKTAREIVDVYRSGS